MAPTRDEPFNAQTIDGITEGVVKPPEAEDRAEVITELVNEVEEAVKWRHEGDSATSAEESSLAEVARAADHHMERMRKEAASEEPDESP